MITRRQAWTAVVTAYQTCTRRYAEMLGHFGLTLPQFEVMHAVLALGPEATPNQIAKRLLVTRGNITGILKRLESRDLLARVANLTDGRSMICQLTPSGVLTMQHAGAAASRFIEAQLAPFDDPTVRLVGETMRQMTDHLETLDTERIAVLEPQVNSRRTGATHE